MLAAILHGKVSRRVEGAEDLLTSVVFGVLEHLPVDVGVVPFLRLARSDVGAAVPNLLLSTQAVEVDFWPWWNEDEAPHGAEPDVVLTLTGFDGRRRMVVIEAKWRSPKSGEGERDQLARQVINGRLVAERQGAEYVGIIYLTAHLALPVDDLRRSAAALQADGRAASPMWWVSWRDLPPILAGAAGEERTPMECHARDAAKCLRRWGLERFKGISIPRIAPSFDFEQTYNFQAEAMPAWTFRG